jgi:hypothetical protein
MNFTNNDQKLLAKDSARDSGRKQYHIICARRVNMIASDVWWNHIARYKRYELLNSMSLEPDLIEEFSQKCYSKLTEDLKLIVDIYYMENKHD